MDDAAHAPGRRFWRLAQVILALVIVVASPYYLLKGVQTVREAWPTPVTDFDVFYDAGALAVSDSRSHLYDPAGRREVPADNRGAIGKFFNPPGMALLHAPLSLLPRAEARLLFAAIVIAAMVATYLIATGRREDTAFLVVSGAALASFLPAYDALYLGHHTLVLGLCVAGSLLAFERGKPTLAGLLTGLLILKPSLFVLPFALLVMKDRRAAAAALVTAVVVGLAPFLVTGLHSLPDYVDLLWSTRADALRLDGERTGGASLMFNWAGFFARLFREDASPYFVWPLSILTVGLAALAWRRLPWPEAFLAAALATVVAVPHILNYDWVLLLAPALFVAARTRDQTLLVLIALLQVTINLTVLDYWTGDPAQASLTLATPMAFTLLAYLALGRLVAGAFEAMPEQAPEADAMATPARAPGSFALLG